MSNPNIDEAPLDLTQREQFDEQRRSVVQPPLAEDESALQHDSVELTACPRCNSSHREALQQPWSEDESSHWRRAPR